MILLKKIKYFGFETKCPLCNSMLRNYLPLDKKYKVDITINDTIYSVNDYETLNVENFMCPVCGADDRTRLYMLYLKEKLKNTDNTNFKLQLLHFAPETTLQKILKKHKSIIYRSADLFMEGVDDKVDITNMKIYPDNTFDIIICSHVLEHIIDINRALSELYRIMKHGAWAIIMVPILTDLKENYENNAIVLPEDRLKFFGQEDHVRIFSKNGFISILEEYGFSLKQLSIDYFGKEIFLKNRITSKSVLYIAERT